MHLTDWLIVEAALLIIDLTQISFVKNWFWKRGINRLLDYQLGRLFKE
jgi:hypothetical protein